MAFLELLKVIVIGIVEGITEWLPISSTGHMLLLDQVMNFKADPEFKEMFFVVIQLGAIIAVIYMYWSKLWPFRIATRHSVWDDEQYERPNSRQRDIRGDGRGARDSRDHRGSRGSSGSSGSSEERQRKISKKQAQEQALWKNEYRIGSIGVSRPILLMWAKVIVATIPAGIIGIFLDDWMEKYAHTPAVIAVALIVYGLLFVFIEKRNEKRRPRITKLSQLTYLDALKIGLFQSLAIVPGTSRSGATIVGGLTMGISRRLATEFSFFMGIPIMFGWSIVKLIKYGFHYSALQFFELLVGLIVAFIVSVFVIRFLIGYIKKNDFKIFGYYRIGLGLIVIIVFVIKAIVTK